MKLVRMWNRREFRNDAGVYQFTTLKIGLEQAWGSNKIEANRHFFTVVSVIDQYWHIKFRQAKCIWYGENQQQLVKSSANCRVQAGWTPMVSPRYKGRLFHGQWRNPVHMHRNQYMWGAMWDVEHSLAMASLNIYKTAQIFKRRKIW